MSSSESTIGVMVMGLLIIGVCIAVYFIPLIVAQARGHRQTTAIFMLNLFLGWTLIGWVGALVWACTNPAPPPRAERIIVPNDPTYIQTSKVDIQANEIQRFAKMRDDGLLTDEEFVAKKRAILGLS